MGIEQQVYLKSDRAGRLLVLVFCLAPVVVPVLAIGTKYALDDGFVPVLSWPAALSSSAQASVPDTSPVTLGILPSRDAFHSPVFAAPSAWVQGFDTTDGETRVERAGRLASASVSQGGGCGDFDGLAEGGLSCAPVRRDPADGLSRGGLALRRAD